MIDVLASSRSELPSFDDSNSQNKPQAPRMCDIAPSQLPEHRVGHRLDLGSAVWAMNHRA